MFDTKWTATVAELRDRYEAMLKTTASIAVEVKAKYAPIIKAEIAERKRDIEYEFAMTLKRAKEETGIPVTVIQDEVLYTRAWARWTKWRDLAGIESKGKKEN